MILAAGFGTRLHPFTLVTPKPLFTISRRAIIDIIIENLVAAGCEAVIVNTHQLHKQIEGHIARQKYPIPIQTRHEIEILGTGGAIKNVVDFMDHAPFLVLNGDLFTDIDLRAVYDFHRSHPDPVTLALYDDPEFNTVSVTPDGFVTGFNSMGDDSGSKRAGDLTFTGIHVIDPDVLSIIPNTRVSNIIEDYQNLLYQKHRIRAYIPTNRYWKDIGTPDRYRTTVFDQMSVEAFDRAWPEVKNRPNTIAQTALQGDGSNRKWSRLTSRGRCLILADHGIKNQKSPTEIESFIHINAHLAQIQVPVPRIFAADTISGLVFMEDLGDTHLQERVQHAETTDAVLGLYRPVIDHLVHMNTAGAENFDPSWTYQSTAYSKEVILEKECRYFVDSFVNGFLNGSVYYETFETEFNELADGALNNGLPGLMHRDFQARNIMIKNDQVYFIDFQGARIGPLQYDLASLLIDPYVSLSSEIQERIYAYCLRSLSNRLPVDPDGFSQGYWFCAVARNLQILGAFANLSQNAGKPQFASYIPQATDNLKQLLKNGVQNRFPRLQALVAEIEV